MSNKKKTPKKDDVLDVFSRGASDIGLDKESSDIVVANLNETTLPMCVGTPIEEIETGDIILIFFVIDESPSMQPVESELIKEFNNTLIPGLKGGASDVVSTIEVGGIAFTEEIRPLWDAGFTKLKDLPELTKEDYDTNRGCATALYRAVRDAFTAIAVRASEIAQGIGVPPKVIVVILSDGANNCVPYDPIDLKALVDSCSNEIFVKAFAGFETDEPVDFKKIAKSIGFGRPFEMKRKPGESDEEMGRRFRRLLEIMSSSLVKQSKTQVTPDSSDNFWKDN